MSHKLHNYSTILFPFRDHVQHLFETKHLQLLHKTSGGKAYNELFKVGMDSSTVFHDKFYNALRGGDLDYFVETYRIFIETFVSTFILKDKEILYQTTPTFRVHLPGNLAVGAFHKDSEFNHPEGEINFIIPLTYAYDTNTVWAESEPDKADFQPINMEYGQLLQFNGNKCTHGNKVNDTPHTRVSLDFRILPLKYYNPESAKSSITKGTKFTIGNYYSQLEL